MKFYDFIRQFNFDDVFKCLKKIDKKSHRKSYLSAWNEILTLEPIIGEFGEGFIEIEEVVEEEEKNWIKVIGFYPNQADKLMPGGPRGNGYYGLDFTDWQEWLGLEVKNLAKLSDIEVLAYILWEMTFCGFSRKQIQGKRNHLLEVKEAIDKGKIERSGESETILGR